MEHIPKLGISWFLFNLDDSLKDKYITKRFKSIKKYQLAINENLTTNIVKKWKVKFELKNNWKDNYVLDYRYDLNRTTLIFIIVGVKVPHIKDHDAYLSFPFIEYNFKLFYKCNISLSKAHGL